MSRTTLVSWVLPAAATVALMSAGCGPTIDLSDNTEAMSTSDGESTHSADSPPPSTSGVPQPDPPATSTTSTSTTTSPTADGDTGSGDSEGGVSFIIEWDYGGPPGFPCSVWEQDCGFDDKCMPWVDDGGDWWNWSRCSPVVDDPAGVGEACTAVGSATSGIDTCDAHSMCWDVDPDTLEGHCVSFCEGDSANAFCENPDDICLAPRDEILVVCLPACDPLLQDCVDGGGCYPAGEWPGPEHGLVCIPEQPNAAEPGDPCDGGVSSCEAGAVCVYYEYVPGCEMWDACCTVYCDTSEPESWEQCSPGQECMQFYEKGDFFSSWPDVGFCGTPLI